MHSITEHTRRKAKNNCQKEELRHVVKRSLKVLNESTRKDSLKCLKVKFMKLKTMLSIDSLKKSRSEIWMRTRFKAAKISR